MNLQAHVHGLQVGLRQSLCKTMAAVLAVLAFGTAQAQTPGDVANSIANVAIEVLTLPKANWAIGLNGSVNDQSGSTRAHSSSLMAYGLRNIDNLTYGGLVTASRTAYSGSDSGYSTSVIGAAEYRFNARWSVLSVAEFGRAPSNYLARQTVVSPLAVYRFDMGDKAVLGLYAGPGFANQELTIVVPGANDNFAVVQGGAVYRRQLSKETAVTATINRAFERNQRENTITAGQLKLDTRLFGGLGLQTSYSITRDEEPFAGRAGSSRMLRVSLTGSFNG